MSWSLVRLASSTAIPPCALEGQAGHLCQTDVGANADGPDHELTGDRSAVGKYDPAGGHLGDRDPGLNDNAVGSELGGHQDGKFGVERGQDLFDRLHDGHGDATGGPGSRRSRAR